MKTRSVVIALMVLVSAPVAMATGDVDQQALNYLRDPVKYDSIPHRIPGWWAQQCSENTSTYREALRYCKAASPPSQMCILLKEPRPCNQIK